MPTKDGTGADLEEGALYFVQDSRGCVGNCGSWWKPAGAGYTCDINAAGRFSAKEIRSMRDTDIPWPIAYVEARVVSHVRVDNGDFRPRVAEKGK